MRRLSTVEERSDPAAAEVEAMCKTWQRTLEDNAGDCEALGSALPKAVNLEARAKLGPEAMSSPAGKRCQTALARTLACAGTAEIDAFLKSFSAEESK